MPEIPDQLITVVSMVSARGRATREKAQRTARTLLEQAGLDQVADSASERVNRLAEDLLSASRTNRRVLEHLVETEVDRAASRLGYARQSEVDALRRELAELRTSLAPTPARKAAVRKAAASKATTTSAPTAATSRKRPAKKAGAQPTTKVAKKAAAAPTTKAATRTTKKAGPRS